MGGNCGGDPDHEYCGVIGVEIFQLKEKCYILKGEVEALKKEVKKCTERQA